VATGLGKSGRSGYMMGPKEMRLQRIFNQEYDRSLIIPIDHGYYLGNTKGLEDPIDTMRIIMEEEVDATILNYGLAKITNEYFSSRNAPARILAIDNAILSTIPGNPVEFLDFELGVSVDHALKAGFDMIKVLFIWGLDPAIQMKEITAISDLVSQCDSWEIPLMIEPLLLGNHIPKDRQNDPELIAHASRIAVELGADILKIPYPENGEALGDIVGRARVPVLILGGSDMETPEEMFCTARESIQAGCAGVVFGRSVWKHGHIRELIRGLKDAVYRLSPEDEIVQRHNVPSPG
jgi:class I fructose-bisphosphate aldolase